MRGHWLPLVVTAPTAAVCKIIKIENLQLGQLVQQAQLLVVSISQSARQCGGLCCQDESKESDCVETWKVHHHSQDQVRWQNFRNWDWDWLLDGWFVDSLLIIILYLQHGECGPGGQTRAVHAVQLRVPVRGRRREQLHHRHQQYQQRLEGGGQQCTPKKCWNYWWGLRTTFTVSSPVLTCFISFRRCEEAARRRAEQTARGTAEADRGDEDETAECKFCSLTLQHSAVPTWSSSPVLLYIIIVVLSLI